MIQALLIEDEPKNIHLLSKIITEQCKDIEIVDICSSIAATKAALQKYEVQLLFMDIMLTDGNTIDQFNELGIGNAQIIFITAHNEYAIKAIKFSALDYLLKPIDIDELKQAVQHAREKIKNEVKTTHLLNVFNINKEKISRIVLPSIDGHSFVELGAIVYIRAEGSYSTFHLSTGERIVVSHPIKEYELLLEPEGFFRIHQSYIINLFYIRKYVKGTGGHVIMHNGTEIDVAARRKDEFLRKTHIK